MNFIKKLFNKEVKVSEIKGKLTKKSKKKTKVKMSELEREIHIKAKFEDCAAKYGFSTNLSVQASLQLRSHGKKKGMAKDLAEEIYMSGIVQIPEGMKPEFLDFWEESIKVI